MHRFFRLTAPKLGSVHRISLVRNAATGPGAHFNAFNLERELILYGSKKQTPVSLKSLMETGKGDLLKSFEPGQQAKSTASELVLFQVACFLHRELPVRIAHRVEHLQSTQFLLKSPSIQMVCTRYKNTFTRLRSTPAPTTPESKEIFTKLLESIYDEHSATLIYIAKGLKEIQAAMAQDRDQFADKHEIQKIFDEFFISRIGIRMLVSQYLKLCQPAVSNMIGLVNLKTSPFEIAKSAIEDATYMCRRAHGDAPDVVVVGRTDLTFPYVPSHLNYMLVELLKNSMRATVETHGLDDLPPIKIVIADGEDNEDVVIKVSDEGGGIKRSNMNRIWSYLYTTANPAALENLLTETHHTGEAVLPMKIAHYNLDHPEKSRAELAATDSVSSGNTINAVTNEPVSSSDPASLPFTSSTSSATTTSSSTSSTQARADSFAAAVGDTTAAQVKKSNPLRDFATGSPLAGLGYGLPIARNYARYFGGELTIVSMEGYGTDGYIYLPRLGRSDASV